MTMGLWANADVVNLFEDMQYEIHKTLAWFQETPAKNFKPYLWP